MLVAAISAAYAQKPSKKERRLEQAAEVQKMIEAQDYKFVAQRAMPMSGRSISLTPDFNLRVSSDTISAYLPYFGRTYVAPINPSDGGITFESTDFNYRIEPAKKGGWTAFITINDVKHRTEATLHITTSGSTILSVNDNTRQSISFGGYIEKRKRMQTIL